VFGGVFGGVICGVSWTLQVLYWLGRFERRPSALSSAIFPRVTHFGVTRITLWAQLLINDEPAGSQPSHAPAGWLGWEVGTRRKARETAPGG